MIDDLSSTDRIKRGHSPSAIGIVKGNDEIAKRGRSRKVRGIASTQTQAPVSGSNLHLIRYKRWTRGWIVLEISRTERAILERSRISRGKDWLWWESHKGEQRGYDHCAVSHLRCGFPDRRRQSLNNWTGDQHD